MKHLKFIRSLPCSKCRANPPSQAAHIRAGTNGGMGIKPDDKWTVPLCHDCHNFQHRTGEISFWGSIDEAKALATRLHGISGDWAKGVTEILRFVKCQSR